MMNTDDLRQLATVGRALWANPRESRVATIETLGAVSLMDLTPERALERAAAALLERVRSRGLAANTRANLGIERAAGPFFRLFPEERLLLVALHRARWSYARLARIFKVPVETIEEMAWGARISMTYAAGAPATGASCPQYDAKRPWTQKFLDDETVGREKFFLQGHLVACASCSQALARCREMYYGIDREIPRMEDDAEDGAAILRDLSQMSRASHLIRSPGDRGFIESLQVFARRQDVRWALLICFILLAAQAFVAKH
jgi:hypothetical protein